MTPGPAPVRLWQAVPAPLRAAAVAMALLTAWMRAGWGGPTAVLWLDDLGLAFVALLAAGLALRASRLPTVTARSWRLIAIGSFVWSLGELTWCYYTLVRGVDPPTVSLAAMGFWTLPLFCGAAIVILPVADRAGGRVLRILDALVVALCVLLVVWNSVLGSTWPHSRLEAVTVIYPLVDVTLLTLLGLTGWRFHRGSSRLMVATAALGLLAFADTSFSYLTAVGRYHAGAWCDVAYFGAFATLAAAAAMPAPSAVRLRQPRSRRPRRLALLAPYLPISSAAAVILVRRALGHDLGVIDLVIWMLVTLCVVGRQALVLHDNRRLLAEVQSQKDQLSTYALTDPLTGLANRLLFANRAEYATAAHARHGRPVAVCWVDLDDFKIVNDTLGHAAGDELLVQVSRRLQATVRAEDTLARLGGDEFAVLVEGEDEVVGLGHRLLKALEPGFVVGGQALAVQASIGIALLRAGDDPAAAEELLAHADVAMYAAKSRGKNQVVMHASGMVLPGADDLALREPLRAAVSTRTVTLDYQPVVATKSGRLLGFEALARWRHGGRAVPPDRFMPLVGRFGLSLDLGDHLLDAALGDLARWSSQSSDSPLVMSVNLSPEQLLDPDLPRRVGDSLARHGLPGRQLCMEITEGALLTDDPNAKEVAHALRRMGVGLALDDFGIGYSSLAHLRAFPLDALKIDKSFVGDVDIADDARTFVNAVVRLGRDLGLRTVAEGVERESQLAVLRTAGAEYIQGYLFAAPMAAKDAERYVAERLASHATRGAHLPCQRDELAAPPPSEAPVLS